MSSTLMTNCVAIIVVRGKEKSANDPSDALNTKGLQIISLPNHQELRRFLSIESTDNQQDNEVGDMKRKTQSKHMNFGKTRMMSILNKRLNKRCRRMLKRPSNFRKRNKYSSNSTKASQKQRTLSSKAMRWNILKLGSTSKCRNEIKDSSCNAKQRTQSLKPSQKRKQFSCEICDRILSTNFNLKRHRLLKHKLNII